MIVKQLWTASYSHCFAVLRRFNDQLPLSLNKKQVLH